MSHFLQVTFYSEKADANLGSCVFMRISPFQIKVEGPELINMALSSGTEVKCSGVSYCLADTERINNREIRRPAASGVSLCSAISIEVTNHLGLEVIRSAMINSCSLHARQGQGVVILEAYEMQGDRQWEKRKKEEVPR